MRNDAFRTYFSCHPPGRIFKGILYRVASAEFASQKEILSGEGARRWGGRWNGPGSFCVSYYSQTPDCALAEALHTIRSYSKDEFKEFPLVLIAVQIEAQRLLDLTDAKVRRGLKLLRSEMAAPWKQLNAGGKLALSQELGAACYANGFQGIIAPSAIYRNGMNFSIFPELLSPAPRIVNADRLPRSGGGQKT